MNSDNVLRHNAIYSAHRDSVCLLELGVGGQRTRGRQTLSCEHVKGNASP